MCTVPSGVTNTPSPAVPCMHTQKAHVSEPQNSATHLATHTTTSKPYRSQQDGESSHTRRPCGASGQRECEHPHPPHQSLGPLPCPASRADKTTQRNREHGESVSNCIHTMCPLVLMAYIHVCSLVIERDEDIVTALVATRASSTNVMLGAWCDRELDSCLLVNEWLTLASTRHGYNVESTTKSAFQKTTTGVAGRGVGVKDSGCVRVLDDQERQPCDMKYTGR